MWHLSHEAQRELGAGLLDVLTQVRDLYGLVGMESPRPGSRFHGWYGAVPLATVAPRRIYFQLVMAVEHALAAQRLLRDPVDFGSSLSVVTRALLEALAVSWWLLEARDRDDLELRVAMLELREFDESRTSVEVATPEGRALIPQELRTQLEAEVGRWSRPGRRRRVPNRTDGVTAMLRGAGYENAEREYGVLSGLAHGAGHMVMALGVRSGSPGPGVTGVQMGLTQRNAEIYFPDLVVPLSAVARRLCSDLGLPAWTERIEQAEVRAMSRARAIFNAGRAEMGQPLIPGD